MYFRKYIRFPEQLSLGTPLDARHSISPNSEFRANKNTTWWISLFVQGVKVYLSMSETYLKPTKHLR